MPSSLQQIVADPEFAKLSDDDKIAVIAKVDPSFNSLSNGDKLTVLQRVAPSKWEGSGGHLEPPPAPEVMTPGGVVAQQGKNFVSAIGENLAGVAKAVIHPVDTAESMVRFTAEHLSNAKDAAQKGNLGNAVSETIQATPIAGQFGRQLYDRASSGNLGGALGDLAAVKGMEAAPDVLAPIAARVLGKSAEVQYRSTLSRRAQDAAVVDRTVPKMLEEGTTFRSADKLNEALQPKIVAAAKNVGANEARIGQQTTSVKPITDAIESAKDQFRNQIPQPNGSIALQPMGARGEAAVAYLDQLKAEIDAHAPNGDLTLENALRWRKMLDDPIARKDAFNNPKDSMARPELDKIAANAVRGVINADPEMAKANRAYSFLKDQERLAKNAPRANVGEQVGGLAKKATIAAVASMLGFGKMYFLYRIARDVTGSTAWKTWSAVNKVKAARILRSGKFQDIAALGAQAVSASAEQDQQQ